MTSYKSNLKLPAKRLVLFVADGLRADKFFKLIKEETPVRRISGICWRKKPAGVYRTLESQRSLVLDMFLLSLAFMKVLAQSLKVC